MQRGGRHHGKKIENWGDVLGYLAYVFHFQPSELWAMTSEEMLFWNEQAIRVVKRHGR